MQTFGYSQLLRTLKASTLSIATTQRLSLIAMFSAGLALGWSYSDEIAFVIIPATAQAEQPLSLDLPIETLTSHGSLPSLEALLSKPKFNTCGPSQAMQSVEEIFSGKSCTQEKNGAKFQVLFHDVFRTWEPEAPLATLDWNVIVLQNALARTVSAQRAQAPKPPQTDAPSSSAPVVSVTQPIAAQPPSAPKPADRDVKEEPFHAAEWAIPLIEGKVAWLTRKGFNDAIPLKVGDRLRSFGVITEIISTADANIMRSKTNEIITKN
jgi:hypothetical protein